MTTMEMLACSSCTSSKSARATLFCRLRYNERDFEAMTELFRDTYRYRELIWALALKDLKVRYKRSVLGFLWALLNPMLLMLVLTLVFSQIMQTSLPHYAIFLLSAL